MYNGISVFFTWINRNTHTHTHTHTQGLYTVKFALHFTEKLYERIAALQGACVQRFILSPANNTILRLLPGDI